MTIPYVILYCLYLVYEDLQHEMYFQAFELENEFYSFNDDEKLVFLFNIMLTSP